MHDLMSRTMLGAILPLHDVRYRARHRLAADGERNCFLDGRAGAPKLVEPIGFEPTTSCVQSTRSPN